MTPDTDDTIIGHHRAGVGEGSGVGGGSGWVGADLDDTIVWTPGGAAAPVPRTVPVIRRPAYRFRFIGRAQQYDLDSSAFIGRRPSAPRIAGDGSPTLITVPSPHKEVSSTHIELSLAGRSVVVTDLRSTNGTVVTVPGSHPRKLRQGESMVLTPGAVVDIGDGNSIEVLPMTPPSDLANDPRRKAP